MRALGPRSLSILALYSALLAFSTLAPCAAEAQDGPAGAVGAHFVATSEGDLGGLLGADLWVPFDWFRIGGFLGVGAVPSEDDTRNRVFMPLGVSLGADLVDTHIGVSFRLRGGLWGGATQEDKLTIGGLVSFGVHLLLPLGGGAAIFAGLDVHGLLGPGESAIFAPGVGLSWTPERDASEREASQ